MKMYKQKGVTLISLMVGLVISLLAVVAMLGIYSNTTKKTAVLSHDTRTDSEKIASIMSLHMSLRNAGFGIEDAAIGTDLILLTSASFSNGSLTGSASNNNGNAIVWSEKTNANSQCSGFILREKDIIFFPPVNCINANNWSTVNWGQGIQLVSSIENITSNIVLQKSSCKMLGSSIEGSINVTIGISNSYIQNSKINTCLVNIKN